MSENPAAERGGRSDQILVDVLTRLRNLLATISEFRESASEALPDWHPAQGDLAGLAVALEDGKRLTGELLSLLGPASAPGGLDLVEVVGDLYPALRQAVGPGILVDVLHATRLSRVRVDRLQLEQAILAVALQARDAMPAGGTLALMTREAGWGRELPAGHGSHPPSGYVELSFHDTGERAPTNPHEASARAEGGAKAAHGLLLVRRLVQSFDGQVDVESTPGGTTVRLWLPRASGEPG